MKKLKILLAASTVAATLFTGVAFTEAAFPLEEKVSFQYSKNKLWAIEGHGFDLAHQNGYTGKGIKIGVIDSGFIDKPYFTNVKTNFSSSETLVSGFSQVIGDTRNAALYHGTTVLSTLTAVLPNAEYNFYASEKANHNIKALMQQAINDDVNIITMSLSNKISLVEKEAAKQRFNNEFASIIEQAKQKNILIIVSSGNDKAEKVNYFTLNDYIISVGSVNNTLNLSSFSNYHKKGDVKFVAAGEKMAIDDPVKNEKEYIQGTSYAAPTVAAMFGILKQIFPNATVAELKGIMESISYDLGENGLDEKYGNGFPTFKNFKFDEQRVYTDVEKAQEREIARLEEMKQIIKQNKLNLFLNYQITNEVNYKATNNSYTVELGEEYEAYKNGIVNVRELQANRYIEYNIKYNDNAKSLIFTFNSPLEANNSYAITFHSPYNGGHLTILDVSE